MRMKNQPRRVWVLLVLMVMSGAVASARAAAAPTDDPAKIPPAQRFSLDNGPRVLHQFLPEAERQAIFVLLPLGLATDPKDRAQWSHLLEHMLIRGVIEAGVGEPDFRFNGETMASSLRLEIIATPERFTEAAETLARMLAVRTVSAEVLQREKQAVGAEIDAVALHGHTHKFALAAWHQIATHVMPHARVRGDVDEALAEAVMDHAETVVPIDGSVLIATCGPVDADVVQRTLAATFGALEQKSARESSPASPTPGMHRATWDVPTRHAMAWWIVPRRDLVTRAALHVMQQLLLIRLSRDADVMAEQRFPLMQTPPHAAGGLVFLVDINVPARKNISKPPEAIVLRFGQLLDPGQITGPVSLWTTQLAAQLDDTMDFTALRARAPEAMRPFIEINWFLQRANMEFEWNAPIEEIREAIRRVDRTAIERLHAELMEQLPGQLILEPSPELAPHTR